MAKTMTNQPAQKQEPVAPSYSQPLADVDVAAPLNPRASVNDPLTPLYALSEEELIALFS
jgi:hypothetical protein